jgi:hypothetical protein
MTTRSIQKPKHFSKTRSFWQARAPKRPTALRDHRSNLGNQSSRSTNHSQALRYLKQAYYLNRRSFL